MTLVGFPAVISALRCSESAVATIGFFATAAIFGLLLSAIIIVMTAKNDPVLARNLESGKAAHKILIAKYKKFGWNMNEKNSLMYGEKHFVTALGKLKSLACFVLVSFLATSHRNSLMLEACGSTKFWFVCAVEMFLWGMCVSSCILFACLKFNRIRLTKSI